jgi:hypothetical protein
VGLFITRLVSGPVMEKYVEYLKTRLETEKAAESSLPGE